MQGGPQQHAGIIFVGRNQDLGGGRHRQDHNQDGRRAQKSGVAQAARCQGSDDGECQHQRAFMRECECEHHGENECCPDDGSFRIMADGERRPERCVRQPHLGRKAKDQRAEQGCRTTSVDRDDAARRTVGRESADQSRDWREIEQQPIDDDSDAGVSAQSDRDLRRQQGQ